MKKLAKSSTIGTRMTPAERILKFMEMPKQVSGVCYVSMQGDTLNGWLATISPTDSRKSGWAGRGKTPNRAAQVAMYFHARSAG